MGKIIYTRNKCIGCTTCAVYDPDHFEMSDDDGKANLKRNTNCTDESCILETQDDLTKAKQAEEGCPTNAFVVED